MSIRPIFVIALVSCTFLGGCAYKPLKAPCKPGDSQPLSSLISVAFGFVAPSFAALDPCGPMRPLE